MRLYVPVSLNLALFALVVAAAAAVGCDRDDSVRAYQAPKDPAPSTQTAAATTAPAVSTAAVATPAAPEGAQWTVPAGWTQDPQPRPMRVATFNVGSGAAKAELIVTRFRAGGFGSMLDNLNRWRQQVGLPPLKDPAEATPEKTTVAGAETRVYDFTGPKPGGGAAKRNRVAMVQTGAGDVWFFRLSGPAEGVEAQVPEFNTFLASVRFAGQ